jgi:hypothetical protein
VQHQVSAPTIKAWTKTTNARWRFTCELSRCHVICRTSEFGEFAWTRNKMCSTILAWRKRTFRVFSSLIFFLSQTLARTPVDGLVEEAKTIVAVHHTVPANDADSSLIVVMVTINITQVRWHRYWMLQRELLEAIMLEWTNVTSPYIIYGPWPRRYVRSVAHGQVFVLRWHCSVFSGTHFEVPHFCGVCSGKLATSNGTLFCPVFRDSSTCCPEFWRNYEMQLAVIGENASLLRDKRTDI